MLLLPLLLLLLLLTTERRVDQDGSGCDKIVIVTVEIGIMNLSASPLLRSFLPPRSDQTRWRSFCSVRSSQIAAAAVGSSFTSASLVYDRKSTSGPGVLCTGDAEVGSLSRARLVVNPISNPSVASSRVFSLRVCREERVKKGTTLPVQE